MGFLWLWQVGTTLCCMFGLLIAVASLTAEHWAVGTWACIVAASGLSSCGLQTLERADFK